MNDWNTGEPPRPGWYSACTEGSRDPDCLRYWNGTCWSAPWFVGGTAGTFERAKATVGESQHGIEWRPAPKVPGGWRKYESKIDLASFSPAAADEIKPSNPKAMLLPADPAERKGIPITTGVIDYFPLALAEVARVSKAGNDQHNPGQPLHWSKGKSTDHADCIPRHLIDRGARDADGQRHTAKLAWRALALLQIELEDEAAAGGQA